MLLLVSSLEFPSCRLGPVGLTVLAGTRLIVFSYVFEQVVGAETQCILVETQGAQARQGRRRGTFWLEGLHRLWLGNGARVGVGSRVDVSFWHRAGDEGFSFAEPAAALPPVQTGCLAVDGGG